MRASLSVLLAAACLAAPAVASGATFPESFGALKTEAYGARFEAASRIVASEHAGTDELLARVIAEGFFSDSQLGAAAAEFVQRKRSGQSLGGRLPTDKAGKNILLISIDTLRSDHLGAYGYTRKTSPTIDTLAARGALFENAISSSSWTLPAHMSIFTSLYPTFHKLDRGGRLGSVRLDASETTLTEVLRAAGYTTTAFVTHPFLAANWGFDRGFDLYKRVWSEGELQSERVLLWLDWHRFHVSRGLAPASFFLFLHYIDPHETYEPPLPYREKYFPDYKGPRKPGDKFVTLYLRNDFEAPEDFRYAVALYDGEINYVDASLKPVFERLREIGWEDSTFVILTSDHGEEFKDHGSMGHMGTLYREQLEVPLILAYPGQIEPGQRIAEQVSLLDIFPTVLEFAGRESPRGIQGRSLVSYLKLQGKPRGAGAPAQRDVFAELGPIGFKWEQDLYRRALRTSRYKLIQSYLRGGKLQKELYDLRKDAGEKNNIYAQRKDEVEIRALEARLAAFIQEGLAYNESFRSKNKIEIDEETQEHLRALGYLE